MYPKWRSLNKKERTKFGEIEVIFYWNELSWNGLQLWVYLTRVTSDNISPAFLPQTNVCRWQFEMGTALKHNALPFFLFLCNLKCSVECIAVYSAASTKLCKPIVIWSTSKCKNMMIPFKNIYTNICYPIIK